MSLSSDTVCQLLGVLLHTGHPSLHALAQVLGVSPRTVQRMLHEQGVSYAELLDRCRCQAACESLRHTRTPISGIAAELGYRDASSFSRAFRRWTGVAARVFRNQAPARKAESLVNMT